MTDEKKEERMAVGVRFKSSKLDNADRRTLARLVDKGTFKQKAIQRGFKESEINDLKDYISDWIRDGGLKDQESAEDETIPWFGSFILVILFVFIGDCWSYFGLQSQTEPQQEGVIAYMYSLANITGHLATTFSIVFQSVAKRYCCDWGIYKYICSCKLCKFMKHFDKMVQQIKKSDLEIESYYITIFMILLFIVQYKFSTKFDQIMKSNPFQLWLCFDFILFYYCLIASYFQIVIGLSFKLSQRWSWGACFVGLMVSFIVPDYVLPIFSVIFVIAVVSSSYCFNSRCVVPISCKIYPFSKSSA